MLVYQRLLIQEKPPSGSNFIIYVHACCRTNGQNNNKNYLLFLRVKQW